VEKLSDRPDIDALLTQYDRMNGIAEHAILKRGILRPKDMDTHCQAALRTLEFLGQRADEGYERLIQLEAYKDHPRDQYFRVVFQPERLSGHEISLPAFLGPYFRLLCSGLSMPTDDSKTRCEIEYADLLSNIAPLYTAETGSGPEGYAYAFATSAHGLDATAEDISALFFSVADALFCGFHCPLTIFEWSTDCSNYFDAGHEWWGSYFWTVAPEGADFIVGIAASTTD